MVEVLDAHIDPSARHKQGCKAYLTHAIALLVGSVHSKIMS
jgi:hypothetical protein